MTIDAFELLAVRELLTDAREAITLPSTPDAIQGARALVSEAIDHFDRWVADREAELALQHERGDTRG